MKIKASNGNGRPCNPHHLFENQDEEDQENLHEAVSNLRYRKFEETAITALTFLNNQPFMEDYEGEAELVWQYQYLDEKWMNIHNSSYKTMDDIITEGWSKRHEIRQIWRILPPSQPVNLASGEQREFKGTKGPWKVEIADGYITGHITSPLHTYAGNNVSRRDSICDPNSMTRNDAYLIAAAPELLSQCQHWLSMFKEYLLTRGEVGKMEVERMENTINKSLGL